MRRAALVAILACALGAVITAGSPSHDAAGAAAPGPLIGDYRMTWRFSRAFSYVLHCSTAPDGSGNTDDVTVTDDASWEGTAEFTADGTVVAFSHTGSYSQTQLLNIRCLNQTATKRISTLVTAPPGGMPNHPLSVIEYKPDGVHYAFSDPFSAYDRMSFGLAASHNEIEMIGTACGSETPGLQVDDHLVLWNFIPSMGSTPWDPCAGTYHKRELQHLFPAYGTCGAGSFEQPPYPPAPASGSFDDVWDVTIVPRVPPPASSAIQRYERGTRFVGPIYAERGFFEKLDAIDAAASAADVKVIVTSSFRPAGYEPHGSIVQPAARSNHLVGHAIDFNVDYLDGNVTRRATSHDVLAMPVELMPAPVAAFIRGVEAAGVRWGGGISGADRDPVHFDDRLNLDSPATWDATFDSVQSCAGRTGVGARVHSPAVLLITDPLGRRLGYDSATGHDVNDFGSLGQDSGAGEPRTYVIEKPMAGSYRIETIGTGDGPYTLELFQVLDVTLAPNELQPLGDPLTITGTAATGHREALSLALDPAQFGEALGGSPTQGTTPYLLPTKIVARPNVRHPERSRLTVSGILDTGPDVVVLDAPAGLWVGGFEFELPGLTANRKRTTLSYAAPGIRFTVAPGRAGSSRTRFTLSVTGDLTDSVDPEGELALGFSSESMSAGGTVLMHGGRYTRGNARTTLVAPDIYVVRAQATIHGDGKDSLLLTAGLASDAELPPVAPDLVAGFGDRFTVTIPGALFRRTGDRFIFRGDVGGVTSAVLDFKYRQVSIQGKGMSLGEFEQGGNAVLVSVDLGTDRRSVRVRMGRTGSRLTY